MNTLIIIIVILVMLAGVAGTVLPVLPGTPVIFLAALLYGFYDHFLHVGTGSLIILFILMLFTLLVDYLAGVYGAKKYGATRYGTWGSFIGGIIGVIFFQLPGIILGPFIGAFLGELLADHDVERAFKVGIGTLVGMLGGSVIKVITAIIMVTYFIIKLF